MLNILWLSAEYCVAHCWRCGGSVLDTVCGGSVLKIWWLSAEDFVAQC